MSDMEDLYEVIKNYLQDDEEVIFTGNWLDCKNVADSLQERADRGKLIGVCYAVYYTEGNYGEVLE